MHKSKLTHGQIGNLAGMVEQAMRLHPLQSGKVEVKPPKGERQPLDAWEQFLANACNADPIMPSYKMLEKYNGHILEFLIEYYS